MRVLGVSPCAKASLIRDSPQMKKLYNKKNNSVRRLKHVLNRLNTEFDHINKYERRDLVKEVSVISKYLDDLECSMEAQKLLFVNEKNNIFNVNDDDDDDMI